MCQLVFANPSVRHVLLTSLSPDLCDPHAVPRTPPRDIQVYNPTPNSLNVRWEPASGQVQQYRVSYTPQTGARRTESVSEILWTLKTQTVISGRICLKGWKTWFCAAITQLTDQIRM